MAWSEAARRAAALARRAHMQRAGLVTPGSTVRFVGKGDKGDERLRMRLEHQDATRDYARVSHASVFKSQGVMRRVYQDVRRSELAVVGLPKEPYVEMYPGGKASRDQAAMYLRQARRQTRAKGYGSTALEQRIVAGRMMQAAMQKARRR